MTARIPTVTVLGNVGVSGSEAGADGAGGRRAVGRPPGDRRPLDSGEGAGRRPPRAGREALDRPWRPEPLPEGQEDELKTKVREWTAETERAALARLQREHPVVLIYARQSRSDFNPDGTPKGPSLEQQWADCERLPEVNGCPVERFRDANRSGKETTKRPGYIALMERIDAAPDGTIGAVVVYDQDRLHRNDLAMFQLMAKLELLGILVLDVKREIRNADQLGWKIRASVNQDAVRKLGERVRDNLAYLKRQGRPLGRAGCGYRNVKDEKGNKSIAINPEMVPGSRKVFEFYATGKFSERGIVQQLNDAGVVGQSKGKWKVGTVKAMLQNPIYIGKPRGVVGDCSHLAIIDEETFARCQRVRVLHQKKKTGSKGRVNPYSLTGLVTCGRCGAPLHGHTRVWRVKGEVRRSAFYRCRGQYWDQPHTCDQPPVKADAVERAIHQSLAYCANPEQVDPAAAKRLEVGIRRPDDPRKALRLRLASLDKERERVIEMRKDGIIEREEATKLLGDINLKKQSAREQLEQTPEADAGWCRDQLGTLLEVWGEADAGQRNALLSEVFESIVVNQTDFGLTVTLVPRAVWLGFFREVVGPGEGKTGRLAKVLASGGEVVAGRR